MGARPGRARASPRRQGSPSSVTASTTSTWSSTARWCTPCSPPWWSATYVGVVDPAGTAVRAERAAGGAGGHRGRGRRLPAAPRAPPAGGQPADVRRARRPVHRAVAAGSTAASRDPRRRGPPPGDRDRRPRAARPVRRDRAAPDDAFEPAASHGDPVPTRCTSPRLPGRDRRTDRRRSPRARASRSPPPTCGCSRTWPAPAGVAAHAVRLTSDLAAVAGTPRGGPRGGAPPPAPGPARRPRPTLAGVGLQIETVRSPRSGRPATRRTRCSPSSRRRPRPPSPASARSPTTCDPPPSTSSGWSAPCGKKEPVRLRRPWPAVSISAPRRPACAARRRRGRRLPHRPRGHHQRRPPRRGEDLRRARRRQRRARRRRPRRRLRPPPDFRPGVGVSSMRERAAELGGTLTIEGQAPGGTRVLAHLPLGRP